MEMNLGFVPSSAGVWSKKNRRRVTVDTAKTVRIEQGTANESSLEDGEKSMYLDCASRSKPFQCSVDALQRFYTRENAYVANVGVCSNTLAKELAFELDQARSCIRSLINGDSESEIVLTGGATEAINILAMSWGSSFLQAGDEIIVSTMEHHSNIIPWQMIAARTGAKLRFLNISPKGDIQVKNLAKAINFRTKLLAVTHVSHVLGSVNDIKSLVDYAKCVNVKVLVDACQSLPYMKVDVKQLGCDFLVGSGNKLFAAGGVGFLYVKQSVLKSIPAFLTGGESMFSDVSLDKSAIECGRLEAAFPPAAQVLALASSIEKLKSSLVFESGRAAGPMRNSPQVDKHSALLGQVLLEQLSDVRRITIYSPGPDSRPRVPICAFNVDGTDAEVVQAMLREKGIYISAGTHQAIPLHRELGIGSSLRVSFAHYNTVDDVARFTDTLKLALDKLPEKMW
mmetsp:Transcript_27851/g.109216  ORF Transcript_27851/g.109216 Transcript_27851/m.109216 type:complete len:454 (+) Transcript_27851:221-1582(+)